MKQGLRLFYLPRPGRVAQYVRAKVGAPMINSEAAQHVLAEYGLALERPPRNLPFGWRSRNVIVETSGGRKVLKRYRPQWRLATIRHEHSILARLGEVSFPAPRLLYNQAGDSVTCYGEQVYGLFDYVAGTNLASSLMPSAQQRRLMAAAGALLAHYHRQLAGFQPHGEHHLGYKSCSGGRHQDWAWHERRLRDLCGEIDQITSVQDRAHAAWLAQQAARIGDTLASLGERLEATGLPRLVIHGDYGVHNLSYHRDGSLTLHDFELARIEWRLVDVVSVLSRLRLERSHDFMTAYHATYPLTAAEWRALPEVWQVYKLSGAVLYWHTYMEIGGSYRLAAARERVADADWAEANRRALFSFQESTVS